MGGPRPLVEGELAFHNGLKLYEKVKPGITGWWGCNGRSNIDYRERLELEYYYVKNCSLYLDIVTDDSFHSLSCIRGTGTIELNGTSTQVKMGDTFFIPATNETLSFEGSMSIIISRV